MLMPLDVLGIRPKGVLHLGACTGEEADIYTKAGVPIVVWFECNPNVLPQLRMNISSRIGHYIIEAAIVDEDDKEIEFNITNNNASSSILNLKDHRILYPDITVTQKIKLKTSTVDSLLPKNHFHYTEFDFANLDLQGAELLALKGMKKVLPHLKWVYTEVNMRELYEGCALLNDIDAFLRTAGFERERLADSGMWWGDALYTRKS
jgi:FkbM family methyltransferase